MDKKGITSGFLMAIIISLLIIGFLALGFSTNWRFFREETELDNNLAIIKDHCSLVCLAKLKSEFCTRERNVIIKGKETPEKETCYSLSTSQKYSGTVKKCPGIDCTGVDPSTGGSDPGTGGGSGTGSGTGSGAGTNIYVNMFSEKRDLETLKFLLNYLKDHAVGDRTCSCGTRCDDYAEYLIKYIEYLKTDQTVTDSVREKTGSSLDPLLVLSVIMQESSCIAHPLDDDSLGDNYLGLMQINSNACDSGVFLNKFKGITSRTLSCSRSNSALFDPEYAIFRGVYFINNKASYPNCDQVSGFEYTHPYEKYTPLSHILRKYVGCGDYHSDYVEKVSFRYLELDNIYQSCKDGKCGS
ncbi:MAG TPA: hypothetical protein PLK34_01590 [Candidatus Pacearchaeota archaeon]|nr:hypothetical protein [Candidatus Pacearchaeota archaeon]